MTVKKAVSRRVGGCQLLLEFRVRKDKENHRESESCPYQPRMGPQRISGRWVDGADNCELGEG